MAWVTYDLIRECRERYSDSLPYEAVFNYLESIGFEVDMSTRSSHMHARAPDRQDMWTFTKHGGKSHLTPLEVKALYDKLTEYFDREAERETAKLEARRKKDEPPMFPEWFTPEYLGKMGLRMRADQVVSDNGNITIILIDRDYPELSVRITFDPHKKPLSHDDVDGTIHKLKALKDGYQLALSEVIEPYKNMAVVLRTMSDGKGIYEIRDAQTGDYISEVKIPNMETEDPTARNHLMNWMIEEIGDKLAITQFGVEESEAKVRSAKRETARKLAGDARKQRTRDAQREAEEQARVAEERAREAAENEKLLAQLPALRQELTEMGYSIEENVERDGKKGWVLRQGDDYMHPLRELKTILDTAGPKSRIHHFASLSKPDDRGMIKVTGLQKFITGNPLIPQDHIDKDGWFVELDSDATGALTPLGVKQLTGTVSTRKKILDISDAPDSALHVFEKDGKTYVSICGSQDFELEGGTKLQIWRQVAAVNYRHSMWLFQLCRLRDDMDALDMSLIQVNPNQIALKIGKERLTIDSATMPISLADPNELTINSIEQALQAQVKRRATQVIEACGGTVTGEDESGIHYTLAEDATVHTIAHFTIAQRNLKPVMDSIEAIERDHHIGNAAREAEEYLSVLQAYGYRYENGKHGERWTPPMDVKHLKNISAGALRNERAAELRLSALEEMVGACEKRYYLQETHLGRIRHAEGNGSVERKEDGIVLHLPNGDTELKYARLRSGEIPQKPLLDDTHLSTLQRVAQGYPELPEDMPIIQVHQGGDVTPSANALGIGEAPIKIA